MREYYGTTVQGLHARAEKKERENREKSIGGCMGCGYSKDGWPGRLVHFHTHTYDSLSELSYRYSMKLAKALAVSKIKYRLVRDYDPLTLVRTKYSVTPINWERKYTQAPHKEEKR